MEVADLKRLRALWLTGAKYAWEMPLSAPTSAFVLPADFEGLEAQHTENVMGELIGEAIFSRGLSVRERLR